jgi:hypothetical protein
MSGAHTPGISTDDGSPGHGDNEAGAFEAALREAAREVIRDPYRNVYRAYEAVERQYPSSPDQMLANVAAFRRIVAQVRIRDAVMPMLTANGLDAEACEGKINEILNDLDAAGAAYRAEPRTRTQQVNGLRERHAVLQSQHAVLTQALHDIRSSYSNPRREPAELNGAATPNGDDRPHAGRVNGTTPIDAFVEQHNAAMRQAQDRAQEAAEQQRERIAAEKVAEQEAAAAMRRAPDWTNEQDGLAALRQVADAMDAGSSEDDADLVEKIGVAARALGKANIEVGSLARELVAARGKRVHLANMNPGPRPWVMEPWLMQGFITMLAAPGGRGKTSLLYAVVLSILTGEELVGMEVRRPCSVLMLVQEDDEAEFQRRFLAAARHHTMADGSSITDATFCRRELFVRLAPFTIGAVASRDPEDKKWVREVEINWKEVRAIIAACRVHGIGVLAIDPFANIHDLDENTKADMKPVMDALVKIAQEASVAILLLHHTRKGSGTNADSKGDDLRGSSVVRDRVRTAILVEPMGTDVAGKVGIKAEDRRSYISADISAKANMAPISERKWFRLVSHDLGNASGDDPSDKVAVAVPVKLNEKVATLVLKRDALRFIHEKMPDGRLWSNSSQAGERYVVPRLAHLLNETEGCVAAWLKGWIRERDVRVEADPMPDPETRKKRRGLVVPPSSLAAAEQAAGGPEQTGDLSDEIPF